MGRNSFILCRLLKETSDTGVVEMSQRLLQECEVRSDRHGLARRMDALVKSGWLDVVSKGHGARGSLYAPGERLTANPDSWRAWTRAAETLFGAAGLLTPWTGHPCLAHGSLGSRGLMILEYGSANGPFVRAEARRALAPFASSLYASTALLKERGLVREDRGVFEVVPDWRERVDDVGSGTPAHRKEKIRRRNDAERSSYQASRGIPPAQQALHDLWRGRPCWVCGGRTRETEHVVPLNWGGRDDVLLTRPTCTGCNRVFSALIRDGQLPEIHIGPCSLCDSADPERVLAALADIGVVRVAKAIRSRDADRYIWGVSRLLSSFAMFRDWPDFVFRLPPVEFRRSLDAARVHPKWARLNPEAARRPVPRRARHEGVKPPQPIAQRHSRRRRRGTLCDPARPTHLPCAVRDVGTVPSVDANERAERHRGLASLTKSGTPAGRPPGQCACGEVADSTVAFPPVGWMEPGMRTSSVASCGACARAADVMAAAVGRPARLTVQRTKLGTGALPGADLYVHQFWAAARCGDVDRALRAASKHLAHLRSPATLR